MLASKKPKPLLNDGFTIIELLIVIVVIGILAAITVVSYGGITKRAKETKMAYELSQDHKKMEMKKVINGIYPNALSCTGPDDVDNYCPVSGSIDNYQLSVAEDRSGYTLKKKSEDMLLDYATTNNGPAPTCPKNFIVVPGSKKLGTSDFCVMKYEARQKGTTGDDAKIPTVSDGVLANKPWVSITRDNAIKYSKNVENCKDCHLMKDVEYATIVENILKVSENFFDNSKLFVGHSDNSPSSSLAITDKTDTYDGTENNASNNQDQKRTFTLTNGEIIWDFAGNVYEMTEEVIPVNPQSYPTVASTNYYEWNNTNLPSSFPLKSLEDIDKPDNLSDMTFSNNNIGKIYITSNPTANKKYLVVRGGCYIGARGVMAINIGSFLSTTSYNQIGFRVAK